MQNGQYNITSVFHHFVGLALKGLKPEFSIVKPDEKCSYIFIKKTIYCGIYDNVLENEN